MPRLNIKKFFVTYRAVILVLFVYFAIHLINLTLLPIFNDEAIYLDWAWSYTHMPGHLYDSLLDAKQPLMIWMFGFFENFFADPLFAGRFVSVLVGAVTALGIFSVTRKLFDGRAAVIATLLYSITPIFVFYNRQALLEAGVMCVGIWSFYVLLELLHKPTVKRGILLGVVLGIGFLIKSSSLLFVVAAAGILLFSLLKKKKKELLKPFLFTVVSFVLVNLILFMNPLFWQTFSSNSRYSFTLSELFTFPFAAWFSHLFGFFEIGFVFVTPLVFLLSIIGIFGMAKEKSKQHQVFVVFFLLALFLEIFSGKFQSQRYIVAFLPFLIISASYVMEKLWRGTTVKKSVVVTTLLLPVIGTLMLIFNPDLYLTHMAKVSGYSDVAYVRGQTSGYGVNEIMRYIKGHSIAGQPTMVLFGLNAGNPENAIDVYSQKDLQLYAMHIDIRFFQGLEEYPCLTSIYPAFFVTRNNELSGMDRYFVLEKSFPNPDGNYSVRIYTLKKGCTGKVPALSDLYQGAMSKMWQMRVGR